MNWQLKSFIQRICASIPGGHKLYFLLQSSFGGFRNYDYLDRFRQQARIARYLTDHGKKIEGATVFEVGTGWMPLIPVGFWFCNSGEIHSYDLYRYLTMEKVSRVLRWISANGESLSKLYSDFTSENQLVNKIKLVKELIGQPERFLEEAGIIYTAPGDAARTNIADSTIDFHVSTSVFEHIPENILADILIEANRILKPGGAAIHVVDPTDHFAHGDKNISPVNFLQFTNDQWRVPGGNRFAYCNRLFDSDYIRLFNESPLNLKDSSSVLDKNTLAVIESGFRLADEFRGRDHEDLSRRELWYFAEPT